MRYLLTLACALCFAPTSFAQAIELLESKATTLKDWTFRGGDKAAARSKWTVVGDVTLDAKNPGRLIGKPGAGVFLNGDDGRGVDLLTGLEHGDCELHIEFNVAKGSNSGVYFQGQYEVQILDSFGKADKDLKYGDCGGIYNTAPPKTNASRTPGEWQIFDVSFKAPRFDAEGKKIANAKFIKVVHNGVVIHENVEVKGPTTASLGGPGEGDGAVDAARGPWAGGVSQHPAVGSGEVKCFRVFTSRSSACNR